jgi:tRNA pseudouridine55 synthase
LDGVLVVDKPRGPTSHDIVDRARRVLRERRIGHTGTLDPFATGVLALCVGKATRLARFLTGEPIGEERRVDLADDTLAAALAGLVGAFDQLPPSFSARHTNGRRLYELARRGEIVPRTATPVTVHALDLLRREGALLELEVRCSAGTYVRALARDLGEHLGVGGHLTALRRTRSGEFALEQAVPGDDLAGAEAALVPMSQLLQRLPAVVLKAASRVLVKNGRELGPLDTLSGFPQTAVERVRLVDESGALVALALAKDTDATPVARPRFPALHADVVLLD